MPRSDVLPKIFKQDPPTIDDVGLLFFFFLRELKGGGADLKYFWGAFRVVRRKESHQKPLLNVMDHAIPPFPIGFSPFSRHGRPEPAKEKFTREQDHEVTSKR
ncbi:hypothetical protein HPP92_011025 [Vanilla planifolia]|uniref:Uncharacterized protein n=1 Tax=Vanilla planifolia TaxID=51239 RepID=A0A835R4U7_VANPL|nr:hypothetical protein HPP92_011025 [Vanilla planifolia]